MCYHCVFSVWSVVRSDNLFHWLLSCFSHYHPLSLHLSSPPFSPFVICAWLPSSVCPTDSVLENLSSHFAAQQYPPCALLLCVLYICPLFCFLLWLNTYKYTLSLLLLCRKQCTGMGVRGVEGAKVAFQRCQGHPVTHTKRMLAGQWIGLRGVGVERGPSIPCLPLPA